MDKVDQGQHIVNGRRWEDSMPEIENMSRTPAGSFQNAAGFFENELPRSTKNRGVQISLDRVVFANGCPRVGEVHPPVHADDLSTHFSLKGNQGRISGQEVNDGNIPR